MEKEKTPWLTITEAAERLRLNPKTLRNYISRGLMPVHRNPLTGTVRLRVDEVDNWLSGNATYQNNSTNSKSAD